MVLTRLQITMIASPPFSTGAAPGFPGRLPRATGLTSYPSDYLGIAVGWIGFSIRPNQEVLRTLPHSLAPRTRPPLSCSRLCSRSLLVRSSHPACGPVLARSSNLDPSGPLHQFIRSKLPDEPDSTWRGFFRYTPRRAVPCSHFCPGATPSRGTGESCLSHLAAGRGSVDQLHCPFPGHPGVSHGGVRSFFHYRGHCRVLSKNVRSLRPDPRFFKRLFLTINSPIVHY